MTENKYRKHTYSATKASLLFLNPASWSQRLAMGLLRLNPDELDPEGTPFRDAEFSGVVEGVRGMRDVVVYGGGIAACLEITSRCDRVVSENRWGRT